MNPLGPSPHPNPVLVIGWGSELRGDDAAGLVFARRLEEARLPGVSVLEMPQLTPELAWDVAAHRRVVFADAVLPGSVDGVEDIPVLRRLEPRETVPVRAIPACMHSLGPERVLELSAALYNSRPDAWVLYLPVFDFDLGTRLSPDARRVIEEALRLVPPVLEDVPTTSPPTPTVP